MEFKTNGGWALKMFFLFFIAVALLCLPFGYGQPGNNVASADYQMQKRVKLKFSAKKKVKKSSVRISGKTGKQLPVTISVNGQQVRALNASNKGKFKVSVPLSVGANIVTAQVSNGIETKTVSKKVTRKEKKLSDEQKLENFAKSLVSETDDDRTKVLKIYSWITANIKYDWDRYESKTYSVYRSAYETFEMRKGVCSDYAGLLWNMLDDLGIKGSTVSGIADTGSRWGDHTWNRVKLNGENFYMDATWDYNQDLETYNYFLIPEKCISVNHRENGEKLSYSEQTNYVNSNWAYFQQNCPNLGDMFNDDDDEEDVVEE